MLTFIQDWVEVEMEGKLATSPAPQHAELQKKVMQKQWVAPSVCVSPQ